MFRFAHPDYLYLLSLLPLLGGVYCLAVRRRRRRLRILGEPDAVGALMPDASPHRMFYRFLLWLAAVMFLVLALARPQLGSKMKEVESKGVEIMIAIDVSNSMLAQDFEPNRLERTKYAISRILDGLEQDRVGVVVFAGDAYIQLPITSDVRTARSFVERVSPASVSRQGTAIGAAINLAASSFSSQSGHSRAIILITDGENHEDDALAAAERAAEQGIRIYTVGIGTPEGAPIEIEGDFIRDENGGIVVSKLDEATLERIAAVSDGAYVRSTARSVGLQEIIDRINRTERARLTSRVFSEYDERYQWPLGAAVALLFLARLILPRRNPLLARFDIFSRKPSL